MLIASLIITALAAFTLYHAIKIVPQGEQWTVERFGKYTVTLPSGLHFLVPFVYRIGQRVNMMERLIEIDKMDVITRDNAIVRADAVTFYQVTNAARAAYEIYELERAIINLTITNIRSMIGAMELDEVLSDREQINVKLLVAIDEATHAWGVKATRVEIRDLVPPADVSAAMAKQIKAEREKRADIFEAEGAKQAAVLRAEGRKEAAFLEAEAREREAEAEANATAMVSTAISEGDPRATQYFIAQKYVESLKDIAASRNSKLIMMPLETTNLVGSISGVAELLKGFKPDATPSPTSTDSSTPDPVVATIPRLVD
ncbi:UNVERIFIED_CONTAM: hypothetical protein GTU68_044597 [Idotea baltica]|nr:hypothetical protein [Idotea baltica]